MSDGLSRRSVLSSAASLAAIGSACAFIPGAASAVLAPVAPKKLDLRRSAFLPLVGQKFQIGPGRGAPVVLREVTDLGPSARSGAEDQFSLIFANGKAGPVIPQGTYSIAHARQGQISLFIVPVGRDEAVQQYQAVVNSGPMTAIP